MNYILLDTEKGMAYKGSIPKETKLTFEDIALDIESKVPFEDIKLKESCCSWMATKQEKDIPIFNFLNEGFVLLDLYRKLGVQHENVFELMQIAYEKHNIKLLINSDCEVYHETDDDMIYICKAMPFYEKTLNFELEKYIVNIINQKKNEKAD